VIERGDILFFFYYFISGFNNPKTRSVFPQGDDAVFFIYIFYGGTIAQCQTHPSFLRIMLYSFPKFAFLYLKKIIK